MKPELYKKYKTENGHTVIITRIATEKTRYPVFGVANIIGPIGMDSVECWTDDGKFSGYGGSGMDLVEEIV